MVLSIKAPYLFKSSIIIQSNSHMINNHVITLFHDIRPNIAFHFKWTGPHPYPVHWCIAMTLLLTYYNNYNDSRVLVSLPNIENTWQIKITTTLRLPITNPNPTLFKILIQEHYSYTIQMKYYEDLTLVQYNHNLLRHSFLPSRI